MQQPKQLTLRKAIEQYVPDGSVIAMGCSLETMIPFAAGHEIIRRQIKNLTLVGPISDILFDQIIGAGCVRRIRAAWVGNVITGSGYNFRRGVESGKLVVEDHSNLTIAMALKAGAMGVPFMPCRTALGSGLYQTNQHLETITCPFSGNTLTAVAAINPDVAIVHVQRADAYGNAHAWGNLGVSREACLASRHVILTAEEIVAPEIIRSDPNRIITPGFKVDAVVHWPWGAHPSPVPGHYNRDHQMFIDYRNQSRTARDYTQWRQKWVEGIETSDDYLDRLGPERTQSLSLTAHVISEGADFGY
jgi:glutaconate CoA-transferase subunit A